MAKCERCKGRTYVCCDDPLQEDRSLPGHPMGTETICCQEFIACPDCEGTGEADQDAASVLAQNSTIQGKETP